MTTLIAARVCFALVALVCIVIVVYPYLLYPLILQLFPRRSLACSGARPMKASVLFCAFNEGEVLPEKLANLEALKARYRDLEVLVYDDGSTDQTRAILATRPDLLTLVVGRGRMGKAHGMKRLASMATGDVLVFTDANVLLEEESIDHLLNWYADPTVGGVCGTLKYLDAGASPTASVGGAYWKLEEKIKSLESRTGNVMGADGSIFSVRRELYPEFPDTVLDDMTVSMAVVFAGARLIKVEDVVAFERLVSSRRDEFSRKMRIASRAFHTHLYLRSRLAEMSVTDRFKYCSRKLVRWFGGVFLVVGMLGAIAFAATFSVWAGIVLAAIAGLGGALAVHVQSGPVAIIAETVMALLATFVGVLKAVRGHTVATWSPAKSR